MSNIFAIIANNINQHTIDDIVALYANQLIADFNIANFPNEDTKDQTTDCCNYAPTIDSKLDKKYGIGRRICFKLFPVDINDKKMRIYSYIRYNKTITTIRAYKRTIKQKNESIYRRHLETKKTIYNNNQFCTLKNVKQLSDQVINPVPMPVDVPSIDDLQPFFEFLKKSESINQDFVEFKRGIFYKDGRMDLCKQVVADVHIEKLMDALKSNTQVEHFLLGNNIINTRGAVAISNFIKESIVNGEKIKTWYLAGNRINDVGIEKICSALVHSKLTMSLWLKRNEIGPNGALHIANMLSENKSIGILDLTNTGILDIGAKCIFRALKNNNTLRHLYLGACGLEHIDYMISYFEYLIQHDIHGIEYIYLEMNRLENRYSNKLVSVIKNYKHLKGLILSSNRITDCSYILDTLVNNQTIVYLDIGYYKSTLDMGELPNNFAIENKERNIESIINFITNNKTVKVFSFLNTGLKEEDIEKISTCLDKNNTIVMLYYEQYTTKLNTKLIKKYTDFRSRNNYNYEVVREIRHGNLIQYIDSNYRNNM